MTGCLRSNLVVPLFSSPSCVRLFSAEGFVSDTANKQHAICIQQRAGHCTLPGNARLLLPAASRRYSVRETSYSVDREVLKAQMRLCSGKGGKTPQRLVFQYVGTAGLVRKILSPRWQDCGESNNASFNAFVCDLLKT